MCTSSDSPPGADLGRPGHRYWRHSRSLARQQRELPQQGIQLILFRGIVCWSCTAICWKGGRTGYWEVRGGGGLW